MTAKPYPYFWSFFIVKHVHCLGSIYNMLRIRFLTDVVILAISVCFSELAKLDRGNG
jgi:hypothetical protein